MDPREEAATDYETVRKELERAAEHAGRTAVHFRDRNIPSASAHAVALIGHLERVKELLAERAKVAAEFAQRSMDDDA